MSLKDLKRLVLLQVVAIVLLVIAGVQTIDKQNQRQDVMINKHNQMYYEFQHWKATGETDFPGG